MPMCSGTKLTCLRVESKELLQVFCSINEGVPAYLSYGNYIL